MLRHRAMIKRTKTIFSIYVRPLLVLFSGLILVSLVTHPWQNYLTLDDWTNAASVRAFVDGGGIQFVEWTTQFYFTLIFWGALFCMPFGFSLGALHVSTMVLAVFGLWAFYGLLRELDIRRSSAWFGVALMAFLPPFFLLAHSFMDEIPFWSLFIISSYFYITGQKKQKESLIWLAVCFNLLAFFIKIYAIVGILSLLIYRITHRKRLYFDFSDLLPVLGFGVIGGVIYHFSTLFIEQQGVFNSSGLFTEYYSGYFSDIFYKMLTAILNISFLLLPLSVAVFNFRRLRGYVYCGVGLAALCTLSLYQQGAFPETLSEYNIFNLWELGQSRTYIAGRFDARNIADWADLVVLSLGLFSGSVLSYIFLETVNDYRKLLSGVRFVFYLQGILLSLIMIGFWGFSDQFYIFIIPVIIFMALATKPLKSYRIVIGAIFIIFSGIICFTGTLDHINHQKKLQEAYTFLVSGGVSQKDIDAGYTVNGWYAYAAQKPLSLNIKNDENTIHAVTPVYDRPYWIISKSEIPGYKTYREYDEGSFYWSTDNSVSLLYFNYEPPSEKINKLKKKQSKKARKN